jgi:hypothetical protein
MLVRFSQPFLLGGFVLLWNVVANNPVYIALFCLVGVAMIAAMVYEYVRKHRLTMNDKRRALVAPKFDMASSEKELDQIGDEGKDGVDSEKYIVLYHNVDEQPQVTVQKTRKDGTSFEDSIVQQPTLPQQSDKRLSEGPVTVTSRLIIGNLSSLISRSRSNSKASYYSLPAKDVPRINGDGGSGSEPSGNDDTSVRLSEISSFSSHAYGIKSAASQQQIDLDQASSEAGSASNSDSNSAFSSSSGYAVSLEPPSDTDLY